MKKLLIYLLLFAPLLAQAQTSPSDLNSAWRAIPGNKYGLSQTDVDSAMKAGWDAKLGPGSALNATNITSGTLAAGRLPQLSILKLKTTGTPSATTFLRGDSAWATPSVSGTQITGTVPIAQLPVATSGASSSTLVVRADDSRLSDSRTPTSHNHSGSEITSGTVAIARLPVATSGTSSSTLVVRADDSRLSDSRTPTSHNHAASEINSGTISLSRLPVASSGVSSSTALVRADDSRLTGSNSSDMFGRDAAINGILLATDPANSVISATKQPGTGQMELSRVIAPYTGSVTKVYFIITGTAGSGLTTTGGNGIGIYDASMNRLGWANCTSAFTGTGTLSVSLDQTVNLVAGTEYRIAVVSTGTTRPNFRAVSQGFANNIGIAAEPYRFQTKTSTTLDTLLPTTGWSAATNVDRIYVAFGN